MNRVDLSPEVRTLLLSVRWSDKEVDGERIARLVGDGIDWDRLLRLARRHTVEGLLYQRLAGVEIPATARRRLRRRYGKTWARTTAVMTALRPALKALGDAGVSVILLKGADLVDTLYGDPGLRPLSDVDLLIREGDFPAARAALHAAGFSAWDDFPDHLEKGPLLIELHRSLVDVERIEGRRHTASPDLEGVWSRARPGPEDPPHVLRLDLADHLLYVCRHFLTHSFEFLIWFSDVSGLTWKCADHLDWQDFFRRARVFSLHSTLMFIYRFLKEYAEEDLPPPVLSELAGSPCGRLERWLLDRLAIRLSIAPLANLLLLTTIERPSDRLAFLWESSFPKHDVMRQIYPSYRPGLRGWYCLVRAVQLIGLGLATGCRLVVPAFRNRSLPKV